MNADPAPSLALHHVDPTITRRKSRRSINNC
jgi:hypothetical protein